MRLLLLTLCQLYCIVQGQRKAVAVLYESTSEDTLTDVKMVGNVQFAQEAANSNIKITINLYTNIAITDGKHGFHIHAFGNVLGGCGSAKSHYNPYNATHGGPADVERHVGDLGNILITNNAYTGEMSDSEASLYGGNSILGRAVVLHSGEDDLGRGGDAESKATGNAGSRFACGVIGVASDNFNSSYLLSYSLSLICLLLTFLLH